MQIEDISTATFDNSMATTSVYGVVSGLRLNFQPVSMGLQNCGLSQEREGR